MILTVSYNHAIVVYTDTMRSVLHSKIACWFSRLVLDCLDFLKG